MGLFALGAGWISLFFIQGSRGGNDKRLHCLGTVEISGMCFLVAFYCVCFSVAFVLWDFLSLYIDFMMGGWVIRDTHLLPCHGDVAGWVWLRAKPWDAELLSV